MPAPEFDTFIWGWGGDPYDPSALLDLLTTSQIGASSDAFYSNPEYDRLYGGAGHAGRGGEPGGAPGGDQGDGRDPPGGPALPRAQLRPLPRGLQRGRARQRRAPVPGGDRRDLLPAGLLRAAADPDARRGLVAGRDRLRPAGRSGGDRRGHRRHRRLRRRARPRPARDRAAGAAERERASHEHSLARRQGRRGAADAGLRARLQLLPLQGDRRSDDPARAAAAVDPGGDRGASRRVRARQAAA